MSIDLVERPARSIDMRTMHQHLIKVRNPHPLDTFPTISSLVSYSYYLLNLSLCAECPVFRSRLLGSLMCCLRLVSHQEPGWQRLMHDQSAPLRRACQTRRWMTARNLPQSSQLPPMAVL